MKATLSEGGKVVRRIEYLVDGLGRRVARRIDGQFDRAWFYRDALRPEAEIDSAGTFTHYVYTSHDEQSGAPDALIRAGVLYRVVKDQLGSVRLVVNASNGAVAQSIDYDAYGRVLNETGAGFQPFGFAGGLYDADTKLVRFGARDYDPGMGRFTNKYPIGFAGQQGNQYLYVDGEPVNRVDPRGLRPLTANEKAFLSKYYGNSLDVNAIDIGLLPAPMSTLGFGGMSPWPGKILLPRQLFHGGSSDNELVLDNTKVARDFAHEAFHVWQRQHGRFGVALDGLILGIATWTGLDMYGFSRNSTQGVYVQFLQGGLEQQARIFQELVVADLIGSASGRQLFSMVAAYVRSRSL